MQLSGHSHNRKNWYNMINHRNRFNTYFLYSCLKVKLSLIISMELHNHNRKIHSPPLQVPYKNMKMQHLHRDNILFL